MFDHVDGRRLAARRHLLPRHARPPRGALRPEPDNVGHPGALGQRLRGEVALLGLGDEARHAGGAQDANHLLRRRSRVDRHESAARGEHAVEGLRHPQTLREQHGHTVPPRHPSLQQDPGEAVGAAREVAPAQGRAVAANRGRVRMPERGILHHPV